MFLRSRHGSLPYLVSVGLREKRHVAGEGDPIPEVVERLACTRDTLSRLCIMAARLASSQSFSISLYRS